MQPPTVASITDTLFWRHPRENHMTYTEHFWRSAWFAVCFLALAAQAAVHAVVPGVFQTTTTDAVTGWLPVLLEETDPAAVRPNAFRPVADPAGPSA